MKRRLLALILSLSLLVGLMPVAAMAVGEGAGTGSTVADTSTLTSWESVFGKNGALSTKDIGRIWTDKTVSTDNVTLSGDIGPDVTIDKEMDADFLVGLSALGSAAKITGETSIPTDTMIVLDVSPKMRPYHRLCRLGLRRRWRRPARCDGKHQVHHHCCLG